MSPDFARDALGVEPTTVRMPPGHGEHSRRYVKVPWCAYDSGLPKEAELQDQVRALLERFHPLADRIQALKRDHGIEVMVDASVEAYDGFTPPMYLTPDLVQRIADLGAAFWIDLYLMEDKPYEKRYHIEVDRG